MTEFLVVVVSVLSAIGGFILGSLFGSAGKQSEIERADYAIQQANYWKNKYNKIKKEKR